MKCSESKRWMLHLPRGSPGCMDRPANEKLPCSKAFGWLHIQSEPAVCLEPKGPTVPRGIPGPVLPLGKERDRPLCSVLCILTSSTA